MLPDSDKSATHIRLATAGDAAQIAAIYAPVVERTHISFEERAPSADEMRVRMRSTGGKYPWLVAIDGERVVGYAYAGVHRPRESYRWSVETTVYLDEEARGRGIGKALYLQLLSLLRAQRFHSAFAGIALPNDASIALHRSVGFTHVGTYREIGYKHGAWRDTSWWQLQLTRDDVPPQEPLPVMQASDPLVLQVLYGPGGEPQAPTMNDQTNDERRKHAQATWQRLVTARTSGETIEATVKSAVKGGLLVDIEGYRGFLPASQVGVAKGTPIESLAGQTVALKVLDVDETRKRVVVSHRRAMQERRRAARQELLNSLKVGEQREATVVRLADFGAFVDLGAGIDALIPASELAFERVEKPSDVVHVGERLTVRVLRVENGGKKIAVSRKGALSDPWRQHAELLKQGKVLEGKVVAKAPRLEVEVAPGVVGTISDRDANPDDYEVGETIEVSVRSIDYRGRRIRLGTPHSAASFSATSFAPLGVELTKSQERR